jgi:FG-GAP-like repeat/Divergent InlB B-repeat domain/FG-GAP repeat
VSRRFSGCLALRPPEKAKMRLRIKIIAAVVFAAFQPAGTMAQTVSFGSGTTYPVGTAPFGIATGDFNRDGLLDLAVANSGSATISILLGNGDGTFQPAVNTSAGQAPWALIAADLNGDGLLDLAVADETGSALVLLGKGDGTFRPPIAIALDASPRSIAMADLNGDGKPDLAVGQFDVNTTSGHVSILLGNGDGTFQSPTNFPLTGAIPWGLVAADFNGDNRADLAATSFDPSISILLGNGDGSFQPAVITALPSGNASYSVASADLNRDGKVDLLITNQKFCLSTTCSFSGFALLLGNGDGTFRSVAVPGDQAAYNKTTTFGVADFDNDGNLDLALTSWDGVTGAVLIVLGNGDGTFQGTTQVVVDGNPGGILAADFNGDGFADLVVPLTSDNAVVVLLNTARSVFRLAVTKAGAGTGTVSSTPPGISCGTACTSLFEAATQISLVASPAPGSTFASWTGACSGPDANACLVTLTSDLSVSATFNPLSDFSMTPASTSLSMKRGSLATDVLTFTAQGGFQGAISLSCSVSGPTPLPSCSVSPLSVNSGDTATLTVNAASLIASGEAPGIIPGLLYATLLLIPSVSLFCSHSLERERRSTWLIGFLLWGLAWQAGACGGGGNGSGANPGPPPGGGSSLAYVVVVTAMSGPLQHSSTINVVVQ